MSSDVLVWRPLLTVLLLAACVGDVRARRIPNALVALVLGLGLLHAALADGTVAGYVTGATGAPLTTQLTTALTGAAVGLVAWLPLYALGVLGAGDVKLFAAAAAWIGPGAVLAASVYAALAGGVLGLAWLARGLRARPEVVALVGASADGIVAREVRVPYGLAIAGGVLMSLWGAAA